MVALFKWIFRILAHILQYLENVSQDTQWAYLAELGLRSGEESEIPIGLRFTGVNFPPKCWGGDSVSDLPLLAEELELACEDECEGGRNAGTCCADWVDGDLPPASCNFFSDEGRILDWPSADEKLLDELLLDNDEDVVVCASFVCFLPPFDKRNSSFSISML